MRSFPCLMITLQLMAFSFLPVSTLSAEEQVLSRIAFGSCDRQDDPQPIWDAIVEKQPQLFLMIGDNIYGDSADMEVLKAKYGQLAAQPGFQKMKKTCPLLATWDDHDFGLNDGGADFAQRAESQKVFMDFFGVPADSPCRKRAGVYSAHYFGPADKRVQVLLLDTRYFRSPLKLGYQAGEKGDGVRGRYAPDDSPEATILGEEQWTWLEEQLRQPASLRIIASSVQVLANEHGWEKWGNFPRERKRLFELLKKTKAGGVVFISGDRHLAEMSLDKELAGYPIWDITSSSLNVPSGNKTGSGTRFVNEINSHRVGLTYFETNFGLLEIDWQAEEPRLKMEICDESGDVVLLQQVPLKDLQFTAK